MTAWLPILPLHGLTALSTAGVVIAGTIALAAEAGRRRLQRQLEGQPKLHEVERIEEELETKRRQLNELEQQQAQAKQTISEADRLRGHISQLQEQKASLEPIRQEVETLRSEQQQLASRAEHARAAAADAEAKTRVSEQSALSAEVREKDATARLDSNQAELRRTQEALDPAKTELESVRSDLRDIDRQANNAKSIIGRAEEVEARAEEINKIEQQHSEAKESLDEVQGKLQHALLHLDDARAETKRLQARVGDDPETSSADLKDRLADIWKPVLKRIEGAVAFSSETDGIHRVQTYLSDLGLIFHERTVIAFHTALKVAQEAPLLVLAGISGTGKSLLPQRYAEAMGMNFQLVPVQPRWDGPQDLLGFYNFLQEKFVATEFLRALVQMHPYPEEWIDMGVLTDTSEHTSLKDQMLLVLLDEMNLARVEYYFSEFLSRLEVRRTIHEADPEERAKVSLPIDAGPLPANRVPLRVYPGRNTLFVGTMNEDESTQSLSDKVVDRANVMRFARPTTPAAPDSANTSSPPAHRLDCTVWRRWQTEGSLTTAERERLVDSTQRLNDALAEIGRPFGHRLTGAVIRYAEMYPKHVANRIDNALADQIEMRILPKLRGVELDEQGDRARDMIQTVINEPNDSELADAVRVASETSSRRFHWIGVSRATG